MKVQLHQLSGVDCTKFIMAFAVIAIHVQARTIGGGQQFPFIIQWFISLAVPFFFITSGYLLGYKLNDNSPQNAPSILLKNRSLQLFRLYGLWLLIYIPIAVIYYHTQHINIINAIKNYSLSVIINGESPYSWPLWFIYSMAISCFILSLFKPPKKNLIIAFCIFFIVTLFNSCDYNNIILKAIKVITHRSLAGGVFIVAGMLLQSYKIRLGFIGGGNLLLISALMKYFDIPIADLVGGIGVFAFALSVPLKPSKIYVQLRQLSMWIYYTHMLILFPCVIIGNSNGQYFNLYFLLVISSLFVMLLSLALNTLQTKPHFKWLQTMIK